MANDHAARRRNSGRTKAGQVSDASSGDEYVDPSLVINAKREYEQLQDWSAAETQIHNREPKGRAAEKSKPPAVEFGYRPTRRAAATAVQSYREVYEAEERASSSSVQYTSSDLSVSPFASSSEVGRVPSPLPVQTSFQHLGFKEAFVHDQFPSPTNLAVLPPRWSQRAADEARPHSFANPFVPTPDDVQRWRSDEAPSPFIRRRSQLASFNMTTNASPSRNNIVEEYLSPSPVFVEDYQVFKTLSDEEKRSVIEKEALHYGIEKPLGYKVSFHYNPHVEYHHFGSSHPMKPWRLTLTKQLVLAYGLEYTMDLYEPRPASFDELIVFHDREYTNFIKQITPHNMKQQEQALATFGFAGESNDCPVFEGLWNYVCLYSGASMHAAQNLLNQQSDIAINWSGGLHHARKGAASGFCYVNDIVLAIQHLLTQHQRVLYIDIDVHHGDGVEAAFESTDRVFTLSYHKFGTDKSGYPYFPGTGSIEDTGPADPTNRGKGHALNIPIDDGIDDDQYKWLFKTVTGAVVEKYQPTAIVLQSGADSLGGDRLGRFNLNITAHGFCVETVKRYGRPLLLIGGGGYTPRNVARTWCHETSVCVGATLHNDLPTHIPYIQAFQGEENGGGILYPDLHNTKRHDNANTAKSLQNIVERAMENLRYMEGAPSVVVNTRGITEEEIMRIRAEVDRELEEEREDQMHLSVEKLRKTRERNTGGRAERGLR